MFARENLRQARNSRFRNRPQRVSPTSKKGAMDLVEKCKIEDPALAALG